MGFFGDVWDILSDIGEFASDIVGGIGDVFGKVADTITDIADRIGRGVKNAGRWILDQVQKHPLRVFFFLTATMSLVSGGIAGIGSGIGSILSSAFSELWKDIGIAAQSAVGAVSTLGKVIGGVLQEGLGIVEWILKKIFTSVQDAATWMNYIMHEALKGRILTPLFEAIDAAGIGVSSGIFSITMTIDSYIERVMKPISTAIEMFIKVTRNVIEPIEKVVDEKLKPIVAMITATRRDVADFLKLYNAQIAELYREVAALHMFVVNLKAGKIPQALAEWVKITNKELYKEIKSTFKEVENTIADVRSEVYRGISAVSGMISDVQKSTNITLRTLETIIAGLGMDRLKGILTEVKGVSDEFFTALQREMRSFRERVDEVYATVRHPVLNFIRLFKQDERTFGAYSPFYESFLLRALGRSADRMREALKKPEWMIRRRE